MTNERADVRYWDDTSACFAQSPRVVDSILQQVAAETLKWSEHFVVPYNLCPWAAKSVETSGAIQLFVSPTKDIFHSTIFDVAHSFQSDIASERVDPRTAIAFCVLANSVDDRLFEDFYAWYDDYEQDWIDKSEPGSLQEALTLAPFHPLWTYGGSDNPLELEKQSPYPTVTLVSTPIVDKAGATVTARIADENERTLSSKTLSEWKEIYHRRVRGTR